jgi:hypothetical protein
VLVQPATVARWQRESLRRCWRRRSGPRPGRPRIDSEVRALIRRMAAENRLWGAPRIHGELLKLGLVVSERTVSRYLGNSRIAPSQTWRTFFANHFDQLAVTSPVMFCGGSDEEHDIDACGGLPRRDSVSGERSYVRDQWSPVPWHLSPQRTLIDRRIGQAHIHHRRCEDSCSGNDPPGRRPTPSMRRHMGGDFPSSGACMRFRASRRSGCSTCPRVDARTPHHVLSVQSESPGQPQHIALRPWQKRTCACDSDRRWSIGGSHLVDSPHFVATI